MPEGDTIFRAARTLDAALTGKAVVRAEVRRSAARPPRIGARVASVEARGKHLTITFDDGFALHTHLGLYGSWQIGRHAGRDSHVVLEMDDGTLATCNRPLKVTTAVFASDLARRAGLDRLGPDLCRPGVDLDAVIRRIDAYTVPETELGVVLLDQRVAAGIGNVFKSETCFACALDPFTPIGVLDARARRRVYETAAALLRANLDSSRRTTVPGGLAVYGRAHRPCRRCRTPIAARGQGVHARLTYWCPGCQTRPTGTLPLG